MQGASTLAKRRTRRAEYRTFATRRTLETGAHFGEAQFELRHGPAQGVAVHAQFLRRLTLVATVRDQHLAKVLPSELANGIIVADSAGMHLCHQAVQFSSQHATPCFWLSLDCHTPRPRGVFKKTSVTSLRMHPPRRLRFPSTQSA